ncbi:YdeI/OmpD-associated family protein [Mucilaginibacter sp.]
MEQYNVRVHDYIKNAAPFAKPILNHIREVVHSASPLITETIKWGMPFFEYKGAICQMAAFKQHLAFGFWRASQLDDPQGLLRIGDAAAGSFGRINSLADLPSDEAIIHFVLQAMAKNESGIKTPVVKKAPVEKKELAVPDYFEALLNEHPKAKETFYKFSPSHRKEYLQWIIEAKTEATRQKRLDTTIEWLIEGKSSNWKYK